MPLFMVELLMMTCPVSTCGVRYGLDAEYQRKREKDGKSWVCPNGHSLSYHENETDKLRAEKLRLESRLEYVRNERDAAIKATTIQKGRATRFKNERDRIKERIANGVCPCCNRHFVNVERHIRGQHPRFVIPEADDAAQ